MSQFPHTRLLWVKSDPCIQYVAVTQPRDSPLGSAVSLILGISTPALAQTAEKPAPPAPAQPAPAKQSAGLPTLRKPWLGDYDAMVKRRLIRVLVPHSKTMYFVELGQPRGIGLRSAQSLRRRYQQETGQSQGQRRLLSDDTRKADPRPARGAAATSSSPASPLLPSAKRSWTSPFRRRPNRSTRSS